MTSEQDFAREWGTYVANKPIVIDGAPAFNTGDPVPVSHVTRGVISVDAVKVIGDGQPPSPEMHARWVRRQQLAARVDSTIIVQCPRCHRPVCRLEWNSDHAVPESQMMSEDGTSTLTRVSPRRRAKWAPVRMSAEPATGMVSEVGRKTFRCTCKPRGRQVRPMQVTLTQGQVDAGFLAAAEEYRAEVTWLELQRLSAVLS